MENEEIVKSLAALEERTENLLQAFGDQSTQLVVLRAAARDLVETHAQPATAKAVFRRIADEQLIAITQDLRATQVPQNLMQRQREAYQAKAGVGLSQAFVHSRNFCARWLG